MEKSSDIKKQELSVFRREKNIIFITLKSYKHDVWGQSKYSEIGSILVHSICCVYFVLLCVKSSDSRALYYQFK